MSLTFFAKSCAYSWKMSFAGQVLWKRNEVVCARETIGAASAPPATAPVAAFWRNRRRCTGLLGCWDWVMAVSLRVEDDRAALRRRHAARPTIERRQVRDK